ncbi:hypothetical protein HGI30_15015 [Paenibacillus albicereus]|uniref:Uncharacterized protein n=1 Tax=Paenibacillus albicereus TaxID=2726185 RepID=A0A6H2GZ82_9BACL|nr:hypothetical protein [Paenibacillus albicereus]QJC52743.1 hypothetical protein HGI30_15015 [Paenibacillus albicereus]
MTYSREEQETILRFDSVERVWVAWSAFQPHIRKLTKIAGAPINPEYDGERVISGRWTLKEKNVRIIAERILTPEQREAIAKRLSTGGNTDQTQDEDDEGEDGD